MPLPDKQEFLEKLRQALIERDISETDIAPYIERFDRFFERMTQDAENDRSDLLSDIDRIADNIADQISERYDEINRLAERTLTVDRVKPDEDAELASRRIRTMARLTRPIRIPRQSALRSTTRRRRRHTLIFVRDGGDGVRDGTPEDSDGR